MELTDDQKSFAKALAIVFLVLTLCLLVIASRHTTPSTNKPDSVTSVNVTEPTLPETAIDFALAHMRIEHDGRLTECHGSLGTQVALPGDTLYYMLRDARINLKPSTESRIAPRIDDVLDAIAAGNGLPDSDDLPEGKLVVVPAWCATTIIS